MSDVSSFKHFYHGWIGGLTGLVLSHPIDTIKSNVQANKPVNYNIRSLYKGLSAPMITVGFDKAITFWAYHNIKNAIDRNWSEYSRITKIALSGFLTGSIVPFYLAPIDRLKIIKQTNGYIRIKDINFKFMYRGFSLMLLRDPIATAAYFSTFESLKHKYTSIMTTSRYHYLGLSFLFGGISGCVLWSIIYPFDIVKTIVQSDTRRTNLINIVRDIYGQNGIKSFFRGYKYAIMRAIPRHAGTFAMVEYLRYWD